MSTRAVHIRALLPEGSADDGRRALCGFLYGDGPLPKMTSLPGEATCGRCMNRIRRRFRLITRKRQRVPSLKRR